MENDIMEEVRINIRLLLESLYHQPTFSPRVYEKTETLLLALADETQLIVDDIFGPCICDDCKERLKTEVNLDK